MIVKHSLFSKVLTSFLISIISVTLLYAGAIHMSGSLDRMKQNSFSLFTQRMRFASSDLKKVLSMIMTYDNYQVLQSECASVYKNNEGTFDHNAQQAILNELQNVMNNLNVTGGYVIFNDDVFQGDDYQGFYLRDSNPSLTSQDKSDLSAYFGSPDGLKQEGITFDTNWTPNLRMDKDNSKYSFYYKPYLDALQDPSKSPDSYAYWGSPVNIFNESEPSITFSIPLITDQHKVYGVMGVDIAIKQVEQILDSSTLNDENKNAFVIAEKQDDNTYQSIYIHSAYYQSDFTYGTIFQVDDTTKEYHVTLNNNDLGVTAAMASLDLYSGKHSNKADWVVLGFTDTTQLYRSYNNLFASIITALCSALILGIIYAFFASKRLTKPLRTLTHQLQHADLHDAMTISNVDILEMDSLIHAIQTLSKNLSNAESRLSNVLHAIDMPLGAIEAYNDNTVFCTNKISEMLSFPDHEKTTYTKDEFNHYIEEFKSHITLTEKEIHDGLISYNTQVSMNGKVNWLRFMITERDDQSRIIIVSDVTSEIEEREKLKYERDHDVLTHLLNRRAFREQCETILNESHDIGAMVLWDLDNLKYVNDTYGHDAGDLLIKRTASFFEESNIKNCIIARMAGDEFLLFFHHYTDMEQIHHQVLQLHKDISKITIDLQQHNQIKIRISAGLSWFPEDAKTYDDLLKYADYAMYEIKKTKKGGIASFNMNTCDKNELYFHGRQELNDLFEKEEINYAYQPIIDTNTGEVFAFEALMRPTGTYIKTPDEVMKIARAQAQLYSMESYTWIHALKQFDKQGGTQFPNTKIFINSIPSIPLLNDLIETLEKNYASLLNRLVIELIETDEIELDYIKTKQIFAKKWHAEFAIDDYGSGYSGESTLLNYPAKYIKIDMQFITGITYDTNRQELVQNLISYAHLRDLKVIAEGVETYEDMQYLIEHNIDYLQGYYLGKPSYQMDDIPSSLKNDIVQIRRNSCST